MAIQKTASGDLTTSIARTLRTASNIGHEGKKDALQVAEAYGVDPMLRRGEFTGHALGAMATQWLPQRFQHQMPHVTMGSPSYIARGQGIVDPLMGLGKVGKGQTPMSPEKVLKLRNLPEYQNLASPEERKYKSRIPQFEQGTDLFGLRGLGKKAVKVREEKLGKFLAAVIMSLTRSLDSIKQKMDESESGVIVAKDGIAATHKKLEDNSDMLETKLDAIIDALRIQNDMKDQADQDLKVAKKEATVEQEKDESTTNEILMQDMDQAEIAQMQERDRESDDRGDETEQLSLPSLARGGIASGPDSGYLAVLHGDEAVVPLDNNYTQGEPSAVGKKPISSMPMLGGTGGFEMGSNPDTMRPGMSSFSSISNKSSSSNVSGDTNLLAEAIELPSKAAGIVTMGVMGEVLSKGKVPGSAIPQIREVVTPIASAFGISDIVTQNIARGATVAGSEEQRRSIGSSPDASGENKKKNFLQKMWGWVTGSKGGGGNVIKNYRGGQGSGGPIGNVGESAQGGGGIINTISNSAYGGDNGNVAFNFFKDPVKKLKYDPDHPDGVEQKNPYSPGTTLYNIFEKHRMYDQNGLLGSAEFHHNIQNNQFVKHSGPPSQSGAVSNLVNNESMEAEIADIVSDGIDNPDVVLNNQNLKAGSTEQAEYSAIAARGECFPSGFNISPYA